MIPFSDTVIGVVEKVSPSVVCIWTTTFVGGSPRKSGHGSGFVIDPRGYILTNYHVVKDRQLEVEFADGRTAPAKTIGWSVPLDTALIKVETRGLPVVELGDSDTLKVGQLVVAIGKPLDLPRPTVTVGVVSSLGQRGVFARGTGSGLEEIPEGWIQTDAAINEGNSGGPLADERGNVVGMNSAGVSKQIGEGIGFAIPIKVALRVVERFVELRMKESAVARAPKLVVSGKPEKQEPSWPGITGLPVSGKPEKQGLPWTGITGLDVPRDAARQYNLSQGGVLVMRVAPNGAGDKAGIKSGDVITAIDGVKLETTREFEEEISRRKVGERVKLTLKRGPRTISVEFVLSSR